MADSQQLEIDSPPLDGITSLQFSPSSSNHLIVTSWDSKLRLYDLASNVDKCTLKHAAAVLDGRFTDSQHVITGGLDSWVRFYDLNTEQPDVLGTHTDAVSSVAHSAENGLAATGSWDRTVRLWDPRVQSAQVALQQQPERVYSMDIVGSMLVVAMADRHINIYDVRRMTEPVQKRESSLRYQTRTVACMADGQGYATSSVEGRIAVEYFDASAEAQAKKYAFKCHRQTIDGVDHVWPVNALAFHPLHNTFASGGSDGIVCLWDHTAKKRLRQYPKYTSAISALAFSADGNKLAVGVSYMWDEGENTAKMTGPSVFVRQVGDEVKPKTKT
jgi:cell cycle arrest protein BUB3